MNIVSLTPGAAGMYCGGCMRDNALTAALRRAGHDALQVPLYTPLTTDEPDNSQSRIFFGGINVYLQQKSRLLRRLPEWLDKRMDDPALIGFAARFGVKTNPESLGEMTVSMLRGEHGNQAHEIEKLAGWFTHAHKPDVICLSNALMTGMAKPLRALLNVPLVCTLQGEDYFLDHLPENTREKAWELLRGCAEHVDAFIPVSRYYGGVMSARLGLPPEKVHPVHNGIDLNGYAPAARKPAVPAIVYLARMAPEKGLKTLVEAFKILRGREAHAQVRLRIGGSMTGNDKDFVRSLRKDLVNAKLAHAVDFLPNLDKAEKIALLQSGTVFSVPAAYGEAFGLFVLESLACGVPVVEPRHGAFPEVLEQTGGGVLCEPENAASLAESLGDLLAHPEKSAALGEQGRQRVLENFGVERMAAGVLEVLKGVARA